MRGAALALLCVLAACGSGNEPNPARAKERAAIAKMDAITISGRYADSVAACESDWWDFSPSEVVMAGERHCLVQDEAATPGFKTLVLACAGDGGTRIERWTVRFPGKDRLSISRDGAPAIDLSLCKSPYLTPHREEGT